MSLIEAYPLCWPAGQPRTSNWNRKTSQFKTSQNMAQIAVMDEIRRLGGRDPIISTNIKLRNDGLPYAGQREPDDGGVAVYFTYKSKQMCFACDKWTKIKDNMQAIAKTIEALRGIERWGSGDMMERAFTGFAALPSPEVHWTQRLGVDLNASAEDIEASYKQLAKKYHPDSGTEPSADMMSKINAARDQARKER